MICPSSVSLISTRVLFTTPDAVSVESPSMGSMTVVSAPSELEPSDFALSFFADFFTLFDILHLGISVENIRGAS